MSAISPYPLLLNLRSYVQGRLESRPGLVSVATISDLVHTIRRLNDPVPSAAQPFTRIVGGGTNLYTGSSGLTLRDSGYSGNPLSMIPFRPEQSPESWMYIADSLRMRKVKVDGTNFQMGIAPPLLPPTIEFGPPAFKIIEDFNVLGAWTNGGTAGSISVVERVNTTILSIFYEGGSAPAWANIVPSVNSSAFQPGMLLNVGASGAQETVVVDSVYPAYPSTPIQVTGIQYDSGTNGLCTVDVALAAPPPPIDIPIDPVNYPPYNPKIPVRQPVQIEGVSSGSGADAPIDLSSLPISGLIPLQLLEFSGGSEIVQIISIGVNADGTVSFRCKTTGTHTTAETIVGVTSLRMFLNNTHVAGQALETRNFDTSLTAGVGWVQVIAAFDLSQLAEQPINPDDRIHISILLDNPANLVEGRLIFDVDSQNNDFAHNYFAGVFTPSDLTPAVSGVTTFQNALAQSVSKATVRSLAPNSGLPQSQLSGIATPTGTDSEQAATGVGQWFEFFINVSDLVRAGADGTRTLANVQGIRVELTVSDTTAAGFDALWIGGGFGPDVGDLGAPYQYITVYRSSFTGAQSNPSPPVRTGLSARRQSIIVSAQSSPDLQVDLIDYYRFGGSLPQWTYVGTSPNSTPNFEDVFDDTTIATAPLANFNNFQPFPTIDIPRSGTVNVVGTAVTWVSGDKFNVNWAPGMQMLINGEVFTLFRQPTDDTHIEILQSGGTQNAAPFTINDATILGQPVPQMWGPFSQASALFMFAVGDELQPGVLFITAGNNPDAAPDTLQMEVTAPSEPLMNGCIFNGTSYVWSSERMFILYANFTGGFATIGGVITPTGGVTNTNLFIPQDVPGNKGLFAPWFLCAGPGIPKIWYGAKDGIYETSGGAAESITDQQLYLLFPHDGQDPQPITIGTQEILPPDFTVPAKLRLSYSDGFVYFDYQDTNGNQNTLVYDRLMKLWSIDKYLVAGGVVTHYAEEGQGVHALLAGGQGRLFQMLNTTDSQDLTSHFVSEIRMPQNGEFPGFVHFRDLYASLICDNGMNLIINLDGVDTFLPLATGSTSAPPYKKLYTPVPSLKGKVMSIGLNNSGPNTPTPWTLVSREELILGTKKWGDKGAFTPLRPFSDLSARARIQPSK